MEIQYCGGNCIKIITKKATLIIDDNLADLGKKAVTKSEDISIFTGEHGQALGRLTVDQPGEYEVSDVSIAGVAARAHTDEENTNNATMFKIVADDVKVAVVGHIYPSLSEEQLEALGMVDLLFVPVGGHGFTLDTTGALQVIKKIEPKLVIPTNYADKELSYPVPADELDEVLKALAMEPKERTAKLKIKGTELLTGDQTQLIVLERS